MLKKIIISILVLFFVSSAYTKEKKYDLGVYSNILFGTTELIKNKNYAQIGFRFKKNFIIKNKYILTPYAGIATWLRAKQGNNIINIINNKIILEAGGVAGIRYKFEKFKIMPLLELNNIFGVDYVRKNFYQDSNTIYKFIIGAGLRCGLEFKFKHIGLSFGSGFLITNLEILGSMGGEINFSI